MVGGTIKSAAVLGWYNNKNLGDEAFRLAFYTLWPNHKFSFFNHPIDWKDYDALIVGGGSLLDSDFKIGNTDIPIGLIGVGIGTTPNNSTMKLLERSKVALVRNNGFGIKCPDLVFSRSISSNKPKENKVTVMLNNHFCPNDKSVRWHDTAWHWFASEMAQSLDRIIESQGCQVSFFPMCTNDFQNDVRAASYVIDLMKHKKNVEHLNHLMCLEKYMIDSIASSKLVITQRFHGMVFCSMLGVPFVSISGHEKMDFLANELGWKGHVPYYGFTIAQFEKAMQHKDVSCLLEYSDKARKEWKDLSVIVENQLFR